jgi:Cd2+/Zn2+-exporting ATPase
MELLSKLDTMVFDKTGTLTQGTFTVTQVEPAPGVASQTLLTTAALAEHYSNHPIARSIRQAAGEEPDISRQGKVEELAGRGIRAQVEGATVLAGNRLLRLSGL